MRNLITDVTGLAVGQAHDRVLASGVTVVIFDEPATASVDVRGGAPGTWETDLLAPERTVERVDAITLSGGSAFGIDAAGGVMARLAEQGRGYAVGSARVPIVPGAILFDLLNGGNKAWGRYTPYRDLGYQAAAIAGAEFALGTTGAGFGAKAAHLKGGIGSASARVDNFTVGALVAVNAAGSVTVDDGPHFWAAPFEIDGEFGGLGSASATKGETVLRERGRTGENTTIAVVATDARLTKSQARQLAVMAHDGLARAIHPVHTPVDGDCVFAASTGRLALPDATADLGRIGAAAASVLARSIARAVFEATALPFPDALPSWQDRFGTVLR
jgi:L-aminopeptidase/D-esterase-like protein